MLLCNCNLIRQKAHSIKTHLGKTEWWQIFSYFLDAPELSEHEREDLRIKL